MTMKKVLYLHMSERPEADARLLELLEKLNRAYVFPVVIAAAAGPVLEKLREMNVETHFMPVCGCFLKVRSRSISWVRILQRPGMAYSLLQYAWRLSRFIRQEHIDAVSAHAVRSRMIGALAAKLTGVPMIGASALFWDHARATPLPQKKSWA